MVSILLKENVPTKNSDILSCNRDLDFVPLLFGSDINVYSMARAFHERYGLRSTAWGKYATGPCYNSEIITLYTCEQNDRRDYFMQHVWDIAEQHRDKKVFLIGCGDNYVKLCSDHRDSYPENVIAPYPDQKLVNTLFHKERFYQLCEQHGIDYPETFIYRREMGTNFTLPFKAPYILKPANPIMYWQCPYPTQKKAYRLEDRAGLEQVLDNIYAAGYTDSIIIQDFIPGDDTYMRVMTGYSNKEAQVELMALGHVLLEEHTPQGIGNHAVIINEDNDTLVYKLKRFLEAIRFVGFSNFDLKYDQRDGKFKVLELNVRQGRSNYYVTGAGHNLAEYLVNDYILDKPAGFTIAKEKYLWSVVPKSVMFSYIHSQEYKNEMKMLIDEGRINNPLDYAADMKLKRRLSLFKSRLGHIYKYRKYLGKNSSTNPASSATCLQQAQSEKR